MNTHVCIKPSCDNTYKSDEDEAYYCKSCAEANKAIAKQIDAQIASRPKKRAKSAIQEYESNVRQVGNVRGMVVKL